MASEVLHVDGIVVNRVDHQLEVLEFVVGNWFVEKTAADAAVAAGDAVAAGRLLLLELLLLRWR